MVDYLFRTQWGIIPTDKKAEIRAVLFQFLRERQASLPEFVTRSLANLIVRIAVRDWPHEDPTFLRLVIESLKHPESWYAADACADNVFVIREGSISGLLLFRQMAEEFAPAQIKLMPREKDRAVVNIKAQLPQVLNTLNSFLEAQLVHISNNAFSSAAEQRKALLALGLFAEIEVMG